jgi:GT2 family glycosyltransferase
MRIAIYTLTRDRIEYTKHCFGVLREKAGMDFDHYVLDNGSTDGASSWLRENGKMFKKLVCMPENIGISAGSNMMLDVIFSSGDYDLIIKMDNDCEVVTDGILRKVCDVFWPTPSSFGYSPFAPPRPTATPPERRGGEFRNGEILRMVLSPRVNGINKQPKRGLEKVINGYRVGFTSIVGGLFHIVPAVIYSNYRYPLNLPKAWGQDDDFCHVMNQKGIRTGYIEDLEVNHYETTSGQAARYPEYFERKWEEEKKG